MKSKEEMEMERTQADVCRLEKELKAAIAAAERAWTAYIQEAKARRLAAHPNAQVNAAPARAVPNNCDGK